MLDAAKECLQELDQLMGLKFGHLDICRVHLDRLKEPVSGIVSYEKTVKGIRFRFNDHPYHSEIIGTVQIQAEGHKHDLDVLWTARSKIYFGSEPNMMHLTSFQYIYQCSHVIIIDTSGKLPEVIITRKCGEGL